MSTTTAERTRIEALREKEVQLSSERDAVMNRLEGYPAAIAAEREQAWYSNQKNRPLAQLNSKLSKLIAADAKDATALAGLNADLSSIRAILEVETQRESERITAAARKQLAERHGVEESAWADAGRIFGELAEAWDRYVGIAEESISYARANGLDASDALAVTPAPATFREFIALLLAASTDEDVRSEPHTEQLVDSGIYGRRGANGEDLGGAIYDTRVVGTRTLDTRRRLDERDVLYRVVPDLRHVVRASKI